MNHNSHIIGVWIMVASALLFSTAGLFAKGVSAGSWETIFWRGLFAALITVGVLLSRGRLGVEWRQMGKAGWAIAVIGALSTSSFIAAFKATSIANVALIYASAPVITASLAWLIMRERMSGSAMIGVLVAFAGVAILMSGSFGGGNLRGDIMAAAMTVGMAIIIVLYRRFPQTPAALPMVFSSLFLLPACMLFGAPLNVPWGEIAILAVFAVVFSVAAILLAEGAKRVPSGESALLSALEAPLAPLWAWLVFSEMPPLATFIGGGLILAAVIFPQLIRNKSAR